MDSVVSEPPVTTAVASRASRNLLGLVLLAFASYGVLLAWHVGAYAGGSDSSGYMNHARLLATGRLHTAPRAVPGYTFGGREPWVYAALGFKPAPGGGSLVPTYPVGLPLMIAGAVKVVGWRSAGNVVIWLHAMVGVVLIYAAGRAFGLSRRFSVLAAALIGASPLYLFLAVQTMSDVPALGWTTAAVLAAARSRIRPAWAAAAGAAFAGAVLIRPTDLFALAPIALLLGAPAPTAPPAPRRFVPWLLFIAGGIPGAVLLLVHAHATYGRYLTTGYGEVELGLRYLGPSLFNYAEWLPVLLTPGVVAALGLPLLPRPGRRAGLVLGTWIVIFLGFYAFYSCTHETWWYLRFLLPAVPPLVIAALLVARSLVGSRWSARVRAAAVGVAFGLTIVWHWHWALKLRPLEAGRGEEKYVLAADWLTKHVPPNAVIAVMQESGAVFFYTDYAFVRWDDLQPADFTRLTAALAATHRPLYAVLFPFEIEEQHAFTRHMPSGNWNRIENVGELTLWRWSASPGSVTR